MISKLLSGAVKFYLRSQVEQVEDLKVEIVGKNKQILQGYIPQVFLSCDRAVYQGLHLRQVRLNGIDIAVNLPEVIKNQPLKLIEPILVEIQLKLDAVDLQASLNSDLLQSGLSDLWQMILAAQNSQELTNLKVEWQKIAIASKQLNLAGIYHNSSGDKKKVALSTKIDLADANALCLSPLEINCESLLNGNIDNQLEIDLGTDVTIKELTIESEQIICTGRIRVNN